jgi:TRAP-type C4-dicarboxylate transport system permease small subunit
VKRAIVAVNGALAQVEKTILLVATAAMLLSVMAAILTRQFGVDVPWVTPAELALMIVSTFAGAALATSQRRHISMDLLTKVVSLRGRAILSILTSALGACISTFLAIAGVMWVRTNMEFGDPISLALKIPDWYLQAVVPTGFALCTIHFVLNLLLDARGLVTGDLSHLPSDNVAAHGVAL